MQPPAFDAAVVNDPNLTGAVCPGSSGPAVLRAQVLLDRAHFSPGEIDGSYGRNLREAIQGYQRAHDRPPSGEVDPETWELLKSDTTPVLQMYAITPQDVAGPFTKIPGDMMEKAKLPSLNYESPLDQLAERYHISPKLLQQLNAGKRFDAAGETILVPNVSRSAPGQAASLAVTGSTLTVTTFDSQGKVLTQYPASLGSEHDPLPVGTWKIVGVLKNPTFYYNPYLFWDAKGPQTKAQIAPGPRNPVDVAWIGILKEHYGIHGTPEPGRVGHTQSHGCIRLTNWDVAELAEMVKPGIPVVIEAARAAVDTNPPRTMEGAPGVVAADTEALVARRLNIPVPGVRPRDLQDTFTQARSEGRRHDAIDIPAPRGTPVVAVEDGRVVKLFTSKRGGLTVYQFDPQEVYCYYYAHLDGYAPGLREGMRLRRGDTLGYVGTTGDAPANAPHLHFAIFKLGPEKRWWEGTAINPYPILSGEQHNANRPVNHRILR